MSLTLVGNKIVDHSDVAGASPVSAAPITSSFPTGFNVLGKDKTAGRDQKHLSCGIWCALY